tara:strand:+ start:315 stop:779 length:465 start_codon:yes stop_codon:yes gene_type:complete
MKKKISKYISFAEATKSETAKRLDIKNTPTEEHLENMMLVAEKVFEPLREYAGHPIGVNSFYRSPELNKAIRGSSRSSHMIGAAIDLNSLGDKSNKELFDFIMENLTFDQLIWEFGSDKNPAWIHVSYIGEKDNRNEVLKAKRNSNHNTYYKIK